MLDGILVSGAKIELEGDFDHVRLTTSTLDPGGTGSLAWAVDGQMLATTLRISGRVRRLTIDRSIVGPIHTHGTRSLVETTRMTDTIAQSVADIEPVLLLRSGKTWVERSTLLGATSVQELEATDSVFLGTVRVVDHQDGCVRFSALPAGSFAPRPYECVWLREPFEESPILVSTAFGNPAYGQLRQDTPSSIATGSEGGSEMGAFCGEQTAIKERTLLAKCEEQMPLGLAPVLIYVT